MAAWKDDEIATEALRGVIKARKPLPRKYILIGVSVAAVALTAGAFLFRKPAETAPAPSAVSVKAAGVEEPKRAIESVPAPQPQPSATAPKIESDTPPPVPIGVKAAVPAEARPRDGMLDSARECLRAGRLSEALVQLTAKRAHPLEGVEQQEAQVLAARVDLAGGDIASARSKFEALALMPSDSAVGTDALMGNFWCQAGTLSRCRDSELEQVAGGPDSWGKAVALLEQARRLEAKSGGNLGKLEEVRLLYQRALDTRGLEASAEKECVTNLTELTDRLVLDPKYACALPKAVFHKVESGDVLERIAKRYKVNQGQIKVLNRLSEKLTIRQGQILKMLPGDVVLKVDRAHLHGTLYIDGVFIRRYPVGIGPGNATP
ncbi:MAG TPA: LysM peptidoglycan-binding domain-containing protein, partial [Planctomycetota bacterium]|nr:LysM peptidoglycan-binding domain-containing protein [Planctomycetota bacterium]